MGTRPDAVSVRDASSRVEVWRARTQFPEAATRWHATAHA
jgi:hypothetical protein